MTAVDSAPTGQAKKLDDLEARYSELRSDIEAMRTELDASASDEMELEDIERRLSQAMPPALEKYYRNDLKRLKRLPVFNVDYQRLFSYLEFLAGFPWINVAEGEFNCERAKAFLNMSHYGLPEVKEQLLEYMAAAAVRPQRRAPILLFLGPPGMGKASLAKTLGCCLQRPVATISLAAARDPNFLVGENHHRADGKPGSLMRAIHSSGVRNPVIILEEIDHIDWGRADSPGLPLVEILDPRNLEFIDDYMGMPVDISQIWFVITASGLEGIPWSLRANFETIEFPGYTDDEKCGVAQHFLLPKLLIDAGLNEKSLTVERDAIVTIIRRYTRESGVIQLKRRLEKIVRKSVRRATETAPVRISSEQLPDLLGPTWFFREQARDLGQVGVATGLVWTEAGGEVIYVEAVLLPKGRGLILTGRLGKVMRESAETALSYLWSRAAALAISENVFTQAGTHIHVPAGSIPKDGPSAGLTIFVALASLFLQRTIPSDIAMTGELTLTGQLLPVGGIREKALAAHRAGYKRLLLPKRNDSDLMVLPEEIRHQLTFILAEHIDEVLPTLFPKTEDSKLTANTSRQRPKGASKGGVEL